MVDRHITRDSSNKGYIDFGIPPTNDTEIEIKYKATNIEDKIIGSNKFKLHLYEYGSSDYLALDCGGGSLSMDNYIFGLYTLRLDNFSVTNVVVDELVKSGTVKDLSGDSSHIQLFSSGSQYGEVYYVKIWQNGELVVDAVPYQLEDGTGTMYDNVKGSAYAVQGGTLGYVETEADYNMRWYPSGTVCDNQGLYQRDVLQVTTNAGRTWGYMTPIETRKGVLLCPSAIHCGGEATKIDFTKEVPFVRNSYNFGINTGLQNTNDQIMQVTFSVHEVNVYPYSDGRIVGSAEHQIGFNSSKKLYYHCQPSSGDTVEQVFEGFGVDEIYSLEFGNGYVKDLWSGEILYSGDTVDIKRLNTIFMFGGNNSALLFNFKVWQGGSLVVDAVPCRFPLGYGNFVNCVDGNVFHISDSEDEYISYKTMLLGEGVNVDIGSLCKFYKQQKYESTDGGKTWNPVEEYRKGELYETDSEDCFQDQWVERGELCIGYSAHTALVLQHSVDGSTWTDSDPLEMKVGENLGIDSNCIDDYAGYCPKCVEAYKTISCYSETSKNGVLTGSVLKDGCCPVGTSGYVGTCITSVEGDNAFYGESWAAVILPDTISAMTDNTMQSLYGVSSVTVDNQTPPQIGDLGLPESTIIIVPLGCAEKYESADGWNAYDGRIFEEVRGKNYVFKENGETLCKYDALFKKEPLYLVDGKGNEEQLDFYRMGALVSGYSEECGSQGQESEIPICKTPTPTPIDLGVRFTTNTQIIIKLSYSLDGAYDTTIISDDEGKTRLTWEGHNGIANEFFWSLNGITSLRCGDYYQNTPLTLELGNRYVSHIMNDPTTQMVASDRKITAFESASTLKLFTSDDNADVCVYWIKVIQDGNLVLDAASNGKGQLYDYVGGKVLFDNGMGSCDYKFKYIEQGGVEHTVPNDGTMIITNGDLGDDIIEWIRSLTIGNCITTIDMNFMGTGSIESDNQGRLDRVFIPSSVTEIRDNALSIGISDGITFESATPPSIGYGALGDNTIYVPCGCVDAYVNGPGYWSYKNKEHILENPDCNDTQNP